MTTAFRTLTLAVAAVLNFAMVQPVKADHGHLLGRIDNLARAIQAESRELYHELRSISYSNPDLRSAQNEVAQIYQLATRIHDAAHGAGSMHGMDRNVHSLKRLTHHVEEHLAGYRHLRRHVDRIDHLTHDLEDAVHDLDDHDFIGGPVLHTRPSSGITIGGRGISFSIGR